VLQEVLHTSSPRQQQPASLEVQLSVAQSDLVSSQQQVAELSSRLAAVEAARAALQEQLDHLEVKVSLRGPVGQAVLMLSQAIRAIHSVYHRRCLLFRYWWQTVQHWLRKLTSCALAAEGPTCPAMMLKVQLVPLMPLPLPRLLLPLLLAPGPLS
jgi:hypothetical protein